MKSALGVIGAILFIATSLYLWFVIFKLAWWLLVGAIVVLGGMGAMKGLVGD